MAKVNWNLATQGASPLTSPKLSPAGGVIQGSVGGLILNSIPEINRNAANTQVRSVQPNSMVFDRSGEAFADATNRIVKAAFEYNDYITGLTADKAVLEAKKQIRELYTGRVKEDGSVEGGYGRLELEEAVNGLGGYREGVDGIVGNALNSQPESVRTKMILRLEQEKEAAYTRGVDHQYSELKSYERNIRFQERQDILADIELNGMNAFTNGMVDTHLAKYTDLRERNATQEFLAKQAVYGVYNDAMEAASGDINDLTPSLSAYKKTAEAFEKIRGTLDEDVENGISNWLVGHKQVAMNQARAAQKSREAAYRYSLMEQAPQRFFSSITNGNFDVLGKELDWYKSTFKNPETGVNKSMDALKDALLAAADHNGVSVDDKKAFLQAATENIISNSSLSPIEQTELRLAASTNIVNKLTAIQDMKDREALAKFDLAAAKNRQGNSIEMPTTPPADMLPENQVKFYNSLEQYRTKSDTKGAISRVPQSKVQDTLEVYKAKLQDRPLSNSELDKILEMTQDKLVPEGTYATFYQASQKMEGSGSTKKLPFEKEPEYMAIKNEINRTGYVFVGPPPKKPKAGKFKEGVQVEYDNWKTQAEIETAKAANAMRDAAIKSMAEGKEFKAREWYRDYVKNVVNGGSIVNKRPWYQVLGGLGFNISGADASIQEQGKMPLNSFFRDTGLGRYISGEEPSVMEDIEE